MDAGPHRSLTVAITGLAASDSPGPGVAVARCLREAPGFRGKLVGLSFDHRFTGLYATGLFDEAFLIPAPSYGDRSFVQALADIKRHTAIDVLVPALDPDVGLCAATRRSLGALGIHTLVPDAGALRRRAKSGPPPPVLPQGVLCRREAREHGGAGARGVRAAGRPMGISSAGPGAGARRRAESERAR